MRNDFFAVALACALCLPLSLCAATTVRFDDATRTPGDLHQIGAITVTANQPPTVFQPATTLGQGMGVAGPVGETFSFDQQLLYLAGEDFPSTTIRENRIHFTLDLGTALTFTSMTIVPYLTITGPGGPYADLPAYGFSVFVGLPHTGGGGVDIPTSAFGNSTMIGLPYQAFLNDGRSINSLDIFLSTGMGGGRDEGIFFSEYRQQHLSEAQTIQFGFTLVSLDYQAIPEPTSFAVAGVGSFLLLLLRQRRRR